MTINDEAIISAYTSLQHHQMNQNIIAQIYEDRVNKYLKLKACTITKTEIFDRAKGILKRRGV